MKTNKITIVNTSTIAFRVHREKIMYSVIHTIVLQICFYFCYYLKTIIINTTCIISHITLQHGLSSHWVAGVCQSISRREEVRLHNLLNTKPPNQPPRDELVTAFTITNQISARAYNHVICCDLISLTPHSVYRLAIPFLIYLPSFNEIGLFKNEN